MGLLCLGMVYLFDAATLSAQSFKAVTTPGEVEWIIVNDWEPTNQRHLILIDIREFPQDVTIIPEDIVALELFGFGPLPAQFVSADDAWARYYIYREFTPELIQFTGQAGKFRDMGNSYGVRAEVTFEAFVPDFIRSENGVTVTCSDAEFGESWILDGTEFTKRTRADITPENAATTCTSGITNMDNLFFTQAFIDNGFNEDISHWDVSKVTSMASMFREARVFNQDIRAWDVSKVKNMNAMFREAHAFNQPIGQWDVSKVKDMSFMFHRAIEFDQPLNSWDVSRVKNMRDMFSQMSFNQDLSNWLVANVSNMEFMFVGNPAFSQDISGWCVDVFASDPAFGFFSFDGLSPQWGTCTGLYDSDNLVFNPNFNRPELNTYWDLWTEKSMDIHAKATISNQEIRVDKITNDGGPDIESVQLNQYLTSSQIAKLEVGATYALSFSVRSDAQRVGWVSVGQDQEPYTYYNRAWFDITSEKASYTVEFLVDVVYPDLKISFELGTSDIPVTISEVYLRKIADPTMVSVPDQQVYSIDTTYTSVYISDVPQEGFNAFQYTMRYHPDSLKVDLLDNDATLTSNYDVTYNTEEAGRIIVAGVGIDPITMDGALTDLKISYKTGGVSTIRLEEVMLNEGVPLVFSSNARVDVTRLECGDVTGDFGVSALDAAHILRHTVRLAPQYPLQGAAFIAGDVTANGAVTAYDAYFVLRETVGLPTTLSCSSTDYVLKEAAWKPSLEWDLVKLGGAESLGSKTMRETMYELTMQLNETDEPIHSFTIELDAELEAEFVGLGSDWQQLTHLENGVQRISMFGLNPIDAPTLRISNVTGATIEAKVQINESSWLSISESVTQQPLLVGSYDLAQNYPNPFNPVTQIQYTLAGPTHVRLEVYNSLGQKVMELVNGQQLAGSHVATFDASQLSSGVYLYTLTTPSFSQTRKMLLIK